MLDQRGVGLSRSSLDCPEMEALAERMQQRTASLEEAREIELDAIRSCRDRLARASVDLRWFSTAASARDVLALMDLLGAGEASLLGSSYGTRIAFELMRRDPARIAPGDPQSRLRNAPGSRLHRHAQAAWSRGMQRGLGTAPLRP